MQNLTGTQEVTLQSLTEDEILVNFGVNTADLVKITSMDSSSDDKEPAVDTHNDTE